jgi:hypothetical protein
MPTKNTRKPPSTTWGSKERRIYVTVSDPGNGSQFYGDHRHGDPSNHPEVGQQKGKSVTNAAQSSCATANPATHPGTTSATQDAIVGKRFGRLGLSYSWRAWD